MTIKATNYDEYLLMKNMYNAWENIELRYYWVDIFVFTNETWGKPCSILHHYRVNIFWLYKWDLEKTILGLTPLYLYFFHCMWSPESFYIIGEKNLQVLSIVVSIVFCILIFFKCTIILFYYSSYYPKPLLNILEFLHLLYFNEFKLVNFILKLLYNILRHG